MFEYLAALLAAIANYGAGTTSALVSYQPETPKCLMDDKN